MSEKRFELISVCGDYGVKDTLENDVLFFGTSDEAIKVCDLLNSLLKKNEQLREILKDIVVATDEKYAKNIYMFKVTVLLDYEKYREIKECLYE